jgi:hypothetical protein
MTKTFGRLRHEPSNAPIVNARATRIYAMPVSSNRPMTARTATNNNTGTTKMSGFHYKMPNASKGPLPMELITRRPTSSLPSNIAPRDTIHSRILAGTGPMLAQPNGTMYNDIRVNDSEHIRTSMPMYAPSTESGASSHRLERHNVQSTTFNDQSVKSQVKTIDRFNDVLRRTYKLH